MPFVFNLGKSFIKQTKTLMAFERNNGGMGGGNFQRQMFSGDWKCSKCAGPIKELPFQPDPARLDQLLCRDCHRQNAPRRDFGGR